MKKKISNAVLICNNDRVNEINERIFERNLAYGNSDIPISFRSQNTKYTLYPILDKNQCSNSEPTNLPFDTNNMFNPGNSKGPWSGYASNINHESVLKNQINALQNNPKVTYIPEKNSQLYEYVLTNEKNNKLDDFHDLFKTPTFSNNNSNKSTISKLNNSLESLFNNHTRQQLKDT